MDKTYFSLLAGMVFGIAAGTVCYHFGHPAGLYFFLGITVLLMVIYLRRFARHTFREMEREVMAANLAAMRLNPVNQHGRPPETIKDNALRRAEETLEKMEEETEAACLPPVSRYVLGFMFDKGHSHNPFVVLIRRKPKRIEQAWQTNLLNGVGGKIEVGETPLQAMVREFREETGVDTECDDWQKYAELGGQSGFHVTVFRAFGDTSQAQTVTNEPLERMLADDASYRADLIPNLRWLIPLALERGGPQTVVAKYR